MIMRQFFNIKTGLALLLLVSKLAGAQQDGRDKQLVLEKEKLAELDEKMNHSIDL